MRDDALVFLVSVAIFFILQSCLNIFEWYVIIYRDISHTITRCSIEVYRVMVRSSTKICTCSVEKWQSMVLLEPWLSKIWKMVVHVEVACVVYIRYIVSEPECSGALRKIHFHARRHSSSEVESVDHLKVMP